MASAGAITPATMPTNNLRALERQLEEENTMLTANINQLKMAQQKFTEAASVVSALTLDKKGACAPWIALCPPSPALARPSHPHSLHPASSTPPHPPTLPPGREILVPLTGSLYVAGVLDPEERVLVDIGTSLFVGKTVADAKELLQRKATLLRTNTDTLYKVITEKRSNLDTVQEELQRRQ